jgi:IS5 family transposase
MPIAIKLLDLLNPEDPLFRLTNKIDWDHLGKAVGSYCSDDIGRPPIPTRLMVGLHYLKYLESLSDEEIVAGFVHNPYWQYFCGREYFEHQLPLHPTSLTKWRKKVGLAAVEKLLEETLNIAKREGFCRSKDLQRVNFDTTVQEKNIAFPTDARLYHKMRRKLVTAAQKRLLSLRQTYERVGQRAFKMQSRYAHARQMNRSRSQLRKLKGFLGRVVRDIERKYLQPDDQMKSLLILAKRLLEQKKNDHNKIYSLHAPEVECIAKGKVNKKYEFGCKVAIATTSLNNWIVGVNAVHGNPYDGKTLKSSIDQVERLCGQRPKEAYVDRGYKGAQYHPDDVDVKIAGTKKKSTSPTLRKFFKRRSAIEPVIGHVKSDHRMGRNYLLGEIGDRLNAILSGAAFNLKKILNLIQLQEV